MGKLHKLAGGRSKVAGLVPMRTAQRLLGGVFCEPCGQGASIKCNNAVRMPWGEVWPAHRQLRADAHGDISHGDISVRNIRIIRNGEFLLYSSYSEHSNAMAGGGAPGSEHSSAIRCRSANCGWTPSERHADIYCSCRFEASLRR